MSLLVYLSLKIGQSFVSKICYWSKLGREQCSGWKLGHAGRIGGAGHEAINECSEFTACLVFNLLSPHSEGSFK